MNKYLSFLSILVLLNAQNFQITPEFTYQYESDNEQYSVENLAIQDFDFVLRGRYQYDNLQILCRMGYHLVDGTLLDPSDFTRTQGYQYFVSDKGLENQRNYWISDMRLNYGDSASYYYINKWDKQWGPGVNSLTISNKIPSFLHFGFKWQLKEDIHFEYFHGKLKSNIDDTLYAGYYDYVGYNPIDINRNIVGHRIEWKPFKHLIISGSELIVYANRELELTYLLPFVPYFPIQSYIGETDNVIMSGDIQFLPNENVRVYGVFFMDEWAPTYTFKEDNNNWFGWQTGFEWKGAFLQKSRLRMEYTWTDHRIYRHRFPVNDFYSWGYPVGFWAGPHAQELYADYSFSYGKNRIEIMFSDAKRGKLTDVGAHVGGSLIKFAQTGWQVHAFEPDNFNREKLKILCKREALNNVAIDSRAVSDKVDLNLSFFRSDVSSGISSLSVFDKSHEESQRVETVTLSNYCADNNLKNVDFFKIDTEGYDLMVLKGFPFDTIKPKVILTEFENNKTIPLGYNFNDLANYLVDNHYFVAVSEWYPVVRYGGNHKFRGITFYPCDLIDENATGNLIASQNKKLLDEIVSLVKKYMYSN